MQTLKKALYLLPAIPLAGWFVFGESTHNLLAKLGSGSAAVRFASLTRAMSVIREHPLLGIGYGDPNVPAIHFLGAVGQIGILGVVMVCAVLIVPNVQLLWKRDPILVLLIPVVLTTLFSQPLYDKALFFLLIAVCVAYRRSYQSLGVRNAPASGGFFRRLVA